MGWCLFWGGGGDVELAVLLALALLFFYPRLCIIVVSFFFKRPFLILLSGSDWICMRLLTGRFCTSERSFRRIAAYMELLFEGLKLVGLRTIVKSPLSTMNISNT